MTTDFSKMTESELLEQVKQSLLNYQLFELTKVMRELCDQMARRRLSDDD